ncbi:helix-turn-helix transcriptional regulator (plasmid) [Cupriavidus metallidurans]|uniref:Transcriptional regulator XRE family n=3 Tax=Cupriavidus TaxID=106589 RepID=Q1LA05_CUPMC|nr:MULTISPECIES: helix-turn-helix transcriptional regulator [Cupriavidus]ABF13021.1 transcriptional regulator XRE family [Cupriavidus metallidurans CH34]AZG12188.1 XRE family transcriptional regulator [Cupriavidus pauculus]QBP14315.1 XRE family transcriptional regulator [Cupriavidus metallidurans]QGS31098.1 XRE family transcriptional regulator [Cupriavidus metallidurans]
MTKSAPAHGGGSHAAAPTRRVSAKSRKTTEVTAKMTTHEQHGAESTASEHEAEASGKRHVDGIRLINLIRKTLIDRGLPQRTISDILGVTPVYWNSIMSGNRSIKSLGKDRFDTIAEWLGIPTVQVLNQADYLSIEDFYSKKDLHEQLWLAIVKMANDPQWMAYAPTREEWDVLPLRVQIGYAALYERDYGRVLTAKAQIEVPDLVS